MTVKKKIIITCDKVQEVGYRPFLLGIAESLEIDRFFADNIFINKRQAVYALVCSTEENVNAFIKIASSNFPDESDVEKVDVEDYEGNVMKAENYYRYLTATQLSKIGTYGIRMLEKQDTSIQILSSVKQDTSDMKSVLSRIETDMKDTKLSLSTFIEERYRKLEGEVAEIKSTLAKMQEA